MSTRCLLFVYGTLQPSHAPPQSMTRSWCDRIRADLYDLGEYPIACDVGRSARWSRGFVLEIDETELARLDIYEGVQDGLYRRKRTTTEAGYDVWVYEFAKVPSASAIGPIDCWPSPG